MSGARVTACRSCASERLAPVVDLGKTPVANQLIDHEDDHVDVFPLETVFCADCALVQLGYALPADRIFDDDYPYFSSFSDAFVEHAASHVKGLVADRGLDADSLMVEVASNDGYLLRHAVDAGIKVLGVDPAPGPAAAAEAVEVPTVVGFFGVDVAEQIAREHGHADVIIANNVMAHVPDLNDFVGGFAMLLADDGLLTVENPSVREMIERVAFDTIYHEHYCYFSCTSVEALMRRHGLHLNDVEFFPDLHGGTLRWHIGRTADRTARCQQHLDDERSLGMTEHPFYEQFATRVRECQAELRSLLERLRNDGRTVAAYGAAAKGATLLNSTGIDRDRVAYVVDRNVHKQGKMMPGCNLPIRPVEVLDDPDERPDDLLLLAWNFATEIIAQQQGYGSNGGTFYVPVPVPHRVGES